MNALSDWTLTNLPLYGPLLLLGVAYAGSLGIPFPITMVILAAGALARGGVIDPALAFAACVAGAALADHSEYALGRLAQGALARRFGRSTAWQQAQAALNRQGAWAILLTRFWLMPLAPAVNVLAGARYPLLRFAVYDLLGQAVWVLVYGGLGYVFAAEWQALSQAAGVFSVISLITFGVGVVVYVMARRTLAARRPGEGKVVGR